MHVNTPNQLRALLARLGQQGTALPPELVTLMGQLLAILETFPRDGASFNAFKKAGAWKDKPLPPNSPDRPNYITVPSLIEIVNISPATLEADLEKYHAVSDGQNNSKITITKHRP